MQDMDSSYYDVYLYSRRFSSGYEGHVRRTPYAGINHNYVSPYLDQTRINWNFNESSPYFSTFDELWQVTGSDANWTKPHCTKLTITGTKPSGRYGHSSTTDGTKMYIFGGVELVDTIAPVLSCLGPDGPS